MKPVIKGNDVRMFVIQPVYKEKKHSLYENGQKVKDETGKGVKMVEDVFVKEVHLKLWFDRRDLSPYGEYIGSKGQVLKNRSKIYCKTTNNFYTVAHSLKELEEVLQLQNYGNIGFAKRKPDEI